MMTLPWRRSVPCVVLHRRPWLVLMDTGPTLTSHNGARCVLTWRCMYPQLQSRDYCAILPLLAPTSFTWCPDKWMCWWLISEFCAVWLDWFGSLFKLFLRFYGVQLLLFSLVVVVVVVVVLFRSLTRTLSQLIIILLTFFKQINFLILSVTGAFILAVLR